MDGRRGRKWNKKSLLLSLAVRSLGISIHTISRHFKNNSGGMTRINVEMVAKDQRIACVHLGDVCEDNGVCCTAAVTIVTCGGVPRKDYNTS